MRASLPLCVNRLPPIHCVIPATKYSKPYNETNFGKMSFYLDKLTRLLLQFIKAAYRKPTKCTICPKSTVAQSCNALD